MTHHEAARRDDLPDLRPATRFDAALREVPSDPAILSHGVERAHAMLAAARYRDDAASIVRMLGYLGNAYRILGYADEAVAVLTEAVEQARAAGDQRAALANRIRLGEALKYQGDIAQAERLFREAARVAQHTDLGDYRDFALQHLGKCRLEQGDAAEAVPLLEQALALRHDKGDPDLIASTTSALVLARTTLEQQMND
jgi:tetratricopeptide (TPR) repeat protein